MSTRCLGSVYVCMTYSGWVALQQRCAALRSVHSLRHRQPACETSAGPVVVGANCWHVRCLRLRSCDRAVMAARCACLHSTSLRPASTSLGCTPMAWGKFTSPCSRFTQRTESVLLSCRCSAFVGALLCPTVYRLRVPMVCAFRQHSASSPPSQVVLTLPVHAPRLR